MTTFADFYTQNNEAFDLIGKIRLPEDFSIIKKEYYFDDLVMSNIFSFIPKYPKKAKRYKTLRVGVFEVLNTYEEHESKSSSKIIIIHKITPKMVKFSVVSSLYGIGYVNGSNILKRKIYKDENNVECINAWGKFRANKLIPIREMTMNEIMDKSWFDSRCADMGGRMPSGQIELSIYYIRYPHLLR